MIEGTLDVVWENSQERTATPRYRLNFLRYQGFKGGAQRPKLIVSTDGLEAYLIQLGFDTERARAVVAEVRTKGSVTLTNVMMAEESVAAYE